MECLVVRVAMKGVSHLRHEEAIRGVETGISRQIVISRKIFGRFQVMDSGEEMDSVDLRVR